VTAECQIRFVVFFYYFLGQHPLLALLKINLFLICEKIFNVYDNMIPKNFFRKR
jgi:hypothetical protein